MPSRRLFVAGLAMQALAARALAQKPDSAGPLRLGVDRALDESGLARRLQHAFGADTGIAVLLVPGPALAVLEAVRNGETDAALVNAPGPEEDLERQGLVHDRRAIAAGEFIVVGPPPPGPRKRLPPPGHSAVEALERIRDQAASDPASLVFLSADDGSGVHVAEQALWRVTRIEPVAPWYAAAEPGRSFTAQVRARGAYALVERGAWMALGGAPSIVIVESDPLLVESVHAMRSFRITHPAGKIFVSWIAGGRGRAVVARHGGYHLR
ncbi:MAG TPA: substrate-binding domain-containing protein [Caldimonas sp.]|jgi:tungstate transport system substrate-binding protein|nr:substrate-binding domain-containing protein [Caldimonas sp.]HEX4233500.1 substrate-binding domain-containing protein [Caldimonas sp.]